MDFQWLDVGNITDIWDVTNDILNGKVNGYPIPGTQIKAGVWVGINTVIDFKHCNITPPVVISSGCHIKPGATIEGPTVISPNCTVDSEAIVRNSLIYDYIHIKDFMLLDQKTVFNNYCIDREGNSTSYSEMSKKCISTVMNDTLSDMSAFTNGTTEK